MQNQSPQKDLTLSPRTSVRIQRSQSSQTNSSLEAPDDSENTQRLRRRLLQEAKHFLESTTCEGIALIRFSSHFLETSFWVLFLLSSIGLTVRGSWVIFQTYFDQGSITRMRVELKNALIFSNAKICVDFDHELMRARISRDLNETILSTYLARTDVLELNSSSMGLLMFYAASELLAHYSMAENAPSNEVLDFLEPANMFQTLRILRSWLLSKHISLTQLGKMLGNFMCRLSQLELTTFARGTNNPVYSPCTEEAISWFGIIPYTASMFELSFCVNLGNQLKFEKMNQRLLIKLRNMTLDFNSSDKVFAPYVYLDISGDPVSSDLTSDFIKIPMTGCKQMILGIASEMHLLNKRKRACNSHATTKSQFACFGQCKKRILIERCACLPDSWSYLPDTSAQIVPTCFITYSSLDTFFNCSHTARHTTSYTACKQTCVESCDVHFHTMIPSDDQCDHTLDPGERSLQLSPQAFQIPIFEEELSSSALDLLSSLGGLIGLWLGVGMMGICHTLVFPLKLLFRCIEYFCSYKV